MLQQFKDMIERRRLSREIETLSPSELDEVGVSRAELRALVATPGYVTARQTEMAHRHGITDAVLQEHRHDLVTAVVRCRNCAATDECAHFLADPGARGEGATFCPNHDLYRDLAAGKGH